MHTDFEWLFYTEDYRKEHVFKTFTASELYVMGDNQKWCQMSEEVKERNITLEMTVRVFFYVKLAKVYYVAMVALGRMNCSFEGIIFAWQWPYMSGMYNSIFIW